MAVNYLKRVCSVELVKLMAFVDFKVSPVAEFLKYTAPWN
jgi:hypothetical protein